MKKLAVGIVLVLGSASLQNAQAEVKPAIAIIDTAVDTSVVNVAYEVCLMEEKRCPNKQTFMEGPGSATLPADQIYKNGFDHGTIMSLIAKTVNPDVNIVFIRVVPMTNTGRMGIYRDTTINDAMKWVIANKTKFNIVAVSSSNGHHNLKKTADYCPVNPALRDTIVTLQGMGVASLFAAGNGYDKSRLDYPACISEAVAVGAVGPRGNIELYSNGGIDLDFYTLGTYKTAVKNATGTSAATAALASYWAKSYKGNYQSTYDYLKSVSSNLAVPLA